MDRGEEEREEEKMSPEHFNHPLEIVGLKATQASSEPSEKKTSSSRESSLEINSMFEPKPSHSTVALLLAISQQGSGHRLSFCTLSDSDVLVIPFFFQSSSARSLQIQHTSVAAWLGSRG